MRELKTSVVCFQSLPALEESERALFKTVLDTSDGAVATEETIFHPQGGGQPSDRGTIVATNDPRLQLDVTLVRKLPSGLILHAGNFASPEANASAVQEATFRESDSVLLRIDNATRDYHSRLHTAGHLIGIAVRKLEPVIGAVTEGKANHAPGASCVEFGGLIAGEHKAAIQECVDNIVSEDRPVLVRWWSTQQVKEGCLSAPDAVPMMPGEEMWRVVDVDGLGAYPCGGTHLPTTGDVGKVVVRKISRQKGVTKISYEVNR